MGRAAWYKTATSEDRREFGKWAWRVLALYGLLVLAGISLAVVRQHQTPRNIVATEAPASAVTLADQFKR
jgi:hypothetical protein